MVKLVEGWFIKINKIESNKLNYSKLTTGHNTFLGSGMALYQYSCLDKEHFTLRTSMFRDWTKERIEGNPDVDLSPKGPMRSFRLAGKYIEQVKHKWQIYDKPEIVLHCSLATDQVNVKTLQADVASAYMVVGYLLDVCNKRLKQEYVFDELVDHGIAVRHNDDMESFTIRKYHTHLTLRVPPPGKSNLRNRTIGVLDVEKAGLEKIMAL